MLNHKNKLLYNRNNTLSSITFSKKLSNDKQNLFERPCPVCKTYNYNVELSAPVYKFVKCKKCDLIYANNIFNDDVINEYYTNSEDHDKHWSNKKKKNLSRNQPIVKDILKYRTDDKKCLDIGCATGELLSYLQPYFKTVEGIELNKKTAMRCRKNLGINVYEEKLEDLQLKQESYDVIILSQVIEHLNNLELFSNIYDILSPDGIIYISCPQSEGISMRFLKGRHINISTHSHINLFNKESLFNLADRFNFDPVMFNIIKFADISLTDMVCFNNNSFLHRYNYIPLLTNTEIALIKMKRKLFGNMLSFFDGSNICTILKKRNEIYHGK